MHTFNPLYARGRKLPLDMGDPIHRKRRLMQQDSSIPHPRTNHNGTRDRKTARERTLDAPVLVLKIDEEIQRLRKEPEWIAGNENGITLSKYPHLRVVLVALRKGTEMQDHAVAGPVSLYVLSGKINLFVGRTKHQLEEKGLCTLRKTIPHRILALEDSVFLLSIIPL